MSKKKATPTIQINCFVRDCNHNHLLTCSQPVIEISEKGQCKSYSVKKGIGLLTNRKRDSA